MRKKDNAESDPYGSTGVPQAGINQQAAVR